MNTPKLQLALDAFKAGADLRRHRSRCKDFTYGRQWGEKITDADGRTVTEGEMASRLGRQPLTHNLTRQLVKSVVGRWRHNLKQSRPADYMPDETARRNLLDELDSRALEEFIISGCCIQRVVYERRPGGEGVWVDNVSPSRFFCNRFVDPRSSDIELVGMLHDMSLREVMMRWGSGDNARADAIKHCYQSLWNNSATGTVGADEVADFFSAGAGRCRVIEMWTLETRSLLQCHDPEKGSLFMVDDSETARKKLKLLNKKRRDTGDSEVAWTPRVSLKWHCSWLTPDGMILSEFDSPYRHSGHPFVVKYYPMTDGEVHSLVEDVIDQQRYINRLISLVDQVMSFSAKGVLMFPVESLPENITWDDIRYQWGRPDGIVPYCGYEGQKPEQVIANANNTGASELLSIEMKMMEQVSGVSNALQGRLPQTITSADALRDSIENATVALLDLYETFGTFRQQRDMLMSQSFYNY